MKRKMTAALIGMMLLLTACGNKDAKDVTEYGTENGSTVAGTEKAGNDSTEEGGTAAPKAKNGSSLIDQLGGENLKHQSDFQIGTKKAKIDVEYTPQDSATLESYRVHAITEDRVYEKEMVQAMLGDSAQEVHRNVGSKQGDADNVVAICTDYYMFSGDAESFDEDEVVKEAPAWVDEEDYYLHTYEGKRNGVDFQMTVTYSKYEQQKGIAFGPKNWGDTIGKPELNGVTVIGEGEYYVIDPDTGEYIDKDTKDLKDKENHASVNSEDALAKAKEFVTETLKLKLPTNGVVMQSAGSDGSAEYDGDDILLYPNSSAKGEGLQGAEVNGYALKINSQISNQECHLSEFSKDVIRYNYGNIWFIDKDIASAYILISLDFEECLSDQVAILPFTNAMEVFQQGVAKQFDSTKVKGDTVEFRDPNLVYFPIQSPDNADEFTYIPAWVLCVYTNNAYLMGEVVVNAMDGSVIEINYESEEEGELIEELEQEPEEEDLDEEGDFVVEEDDGADEEVEEIAEDEADEEAE